MIKVLFQDLKNDFQPKNLSPYILMRVGNYLREGTSAPRQAEPYYKEVTTREGHSHQFPALFGLADIYGDSENSVEQGKAIELLKEIYADAPKKKQKEQALYRIVTILAAKGEWLQVTERAREYLDREKGFRTFSPFVSFHLAESYDNRAMTEDAIAAYTNVWAAYAGFIEISAPSVKRVVELTWKRDRPAVPPGKSDRQISYEFGWKYVDSTRKLVKMMKDDEKALWGKVKALVEQYENDPSVTNMKEVKRLEREGRR